MTIDMRHNMSLVEDMVHALANFVAWAFNIALRAMGYSEIEAKRIEGIVFWALFGVFVVFLIWLTIRFS